MKVSWSFFNIKHQDVYFASTEDLWSTRTWSMCAQYVDFTA